MASAALEPELLAPSLPFSSLHHTASLSLLKVKSLIITHDNFIYPIDGTSFRILSRPFNCKSRSIQKHSRMTKLYNIVAGQTNSLFLPIWASFSLPHWLCFLVGNGTGVKPFIPNLPKHLFLQRSPTSTISSVTPSSGIKSQKRNSLSEQTNLF